MAASGADGAELFVTALKTANVIPEESFGVNLNERAESTSSSIMIGGVDNTSVVNSEFLRWTNLMDTSYWSVPLSGFKMGGNDIAIKSVRGIIDTGASFIMLPATDFETWWTAIKSKSTGTCGIFSRYYYGCPCTSEGQFGSMSFKFKNWEFTIQGADYTIYQSSYRRCLF